MTKSPYQWVLVIFYSFCSGSHPVSIKLVELSIHLELPLIAPFLVMAMASFGVMILLPWFYRTFHLSVQYAYLFYGSAKRKR